MICSYVEWEKYPERKRIAAEILKSKKFSGFPGEYHALAVAFSCKESTS